MEETYPVSVVAVRVTCDGLELFRANADGALSTTA
jgi:hypothetical protein